MEGNLFLCPHAHIIEQSILEIHGKPQKSDPCKNTGPRPMNLFHEKRHDEFENGKQKHDKSNDGENIKPNAVGGRDRTEEIIIQRNIV